MPLIERNRRLLYLLFLGLVPVIVGAAATWTSAQYVTSTTTNQQGDTCGTIITTTSLSGYPLPWIIGTNERRLIHCYPSLANGGPVYSGYYDGDALALDLLFYMTLYYVLGLSSLGATRIVRTMDFFQRCPSCRRRFHVKLVNKQQRMRLGTEMAKTPATLYRHGGPKNLYSLLPIEGEPVSINIDQFQYTYHCSQCGHEWTEKHVEKHVDKISTELSH